MAVFPTPVSPTKIGLFLRRRARMWTVRSSSAARPTSGSSSPAAARSVRFGANAASGSAGTPASSASVGAIGPSPAPGPGSPGPAPSFEMPCEMYCSTSRRVTPCARNSATACESGSWKIAASRSPASTDSFSALSAWCIVCWITRWKASVWSVGSFGSSRCSTSSSKKRSSERSSAARSAPQWRSTSLPRSSYRSAKSRCSTVTYACPRLVASRSADWIVSCSSRPISANGSYSFSSPARSG